MDVDVSGNKQKILDIRDGHGTTLVLCDGANDVDKGEEDYVCSVDFRSRGLPSTTTDHCLDDRNKKNNGLRKVKNAPFNWLPKKSSV